MAKKKRKAAKKESAPEAPVDEEPEDHAEPETADPFAEDGPTMSGEEGGPVDTEAEPEDEAEEAPAGPPEAPTVTFAEKHAQKRGERPVKGDAEKWGITEFIAGGNYTADDIEAVDYYEMAGVSVLTMSDGKKFDVTD